MTEYDIGRNGGTHASCSISYWSGEMHMIVRLSPYTGSLKAAAEQGVGHTLTVTFTDTHGFLVADAKLPLSQFMRIVHGGKSRGLICNSSLAITEESYKRIADWSPAWDW